MASAELIDKQDDQNFKNCANLSLLFWHHVNRNHVYSEEEDADEESYCGKDDQAICGCGKPLSAGWDCKQCRINCTGCNRALASEEKCGRCSVERNTEK